MRPYKFAYLMARLPMGMSFFGHGLIRVPKVQAFSANMEGEFTKTFLPDGLVHAFGYILPFLELLTGILLLAGLLTRQALVLGWLVILALIFGSSLLEQWANVFSQIAYGAYLAGLYLFISYNEYSLDGLRKA